MMSSTIDCVAALLRADSSISQAHADEILKTCRGTGVKRELVTAKSACAILGVSKVTLLQYVRRGLIQQIRYSSRRIRYDAVQIRALAYNGLNNET